MKYILQFIAVIILFAACQKEPNYVPSPLKESSIAHNVQFNVNTFEVSYAGISARSAVSARSIAGSTQYLDRIYHLVYDSVGNLISSVAQADSTKSDFGIFNDTLRPGLYTIVFIGGRLMHPGPNSYGNIYIDSINKLSSAYFLSYDNDIFYSKSSIRVANTDTVFNSIQLPRLTGKLEVRLLDSGFTIYGAINPARGGYKISTNVVDFNYGDTMLYTSPTKPRTLEGYFLGTENKLQVNLQVNLNEKFYYKTIDNIHIYPNKKTILTGRVADLINGKLSITIDTSFSETISIPF